MSQRIVKRILWFSAIIFIGTGLLFLSGCGREEPAYVKNPAMHNLTPHQQHLLKRIEKSGIQVVKRGMLFDFYIPTDCFFDRQSRSLKRSRDEVLFGLSQFLQQYSQYFVHPHIWVSGYTDKVWYYPARDVLSMHYAQSIAEYLRQGGVSGEMITVQGLGAKHPIASNKYPEGTAFNRRVVVAIR